MSAMSVTAQLKLNISDFASKLATASGKMASFAADAAKQTGAGSDAISKYGKTIQWATEALNRHKLGLKDTARIVQGIVISQVFYRAVNAIQSATSAMMEFNETLDYAKVTYAALFGSADLSEKFVQSLREYSEETIFGYEELAATSKELLAYGIPYQNLMYVMEGISSLGTLAGDSSGLDRIAVALGQIYTKGKLTSEEMRQLANAYIPIQSIVKEKFGLTDDQMESIGDLNLPAAEVINAVVDYANEKFGEVSDAAMYTITGLKNKITDSLKNIGADISGPIVKMYKSLLAYITNKLSDIREALKLGGIGGVFEYLVPDKNSQQRIRQFFANMKNLLMALKSILISLAKFFKTFAASCVDALNVVAPVINAVARVLSVVMAYITENTKALKILTGVLAAAAAAWVLLKIKALGAMILTSLAKVIYGVAEATMLLSKTIAGAIASISALSATAQAASLRLIAIVAVLAVLIAAIVGIASASSNADNAISRFFGKLTGKQGSSADDILQLSSGLESATSDAETFSERLDTVSDSLNGVTDAVEDAGSAANSTRKSLLAFDEVFKLNDSSSGGTDGSLDSLVDDLSDIGDLGSIGDALDLSSSIPDFSEYAGNFVSRLKDSLIAKLAIAGIGGILALKLASLLKATNTTGLTASIAGVLTKVLGGAAIGLAIDAGLSLITDKVWGGLEEKLNLEEGSAERASIAATIGTVVGGALGMVVGGPGGAVIGAGLGHLSVGLATLMKDNLLPTNTIVDCGVSVGASLAKGLSLKNVLKNGLIGAAVGLLTDGIASLLWTSLSEKFGKDEDDMERAQLGEIIGSSIGGLIGFAIGGPVGSMIGTAVGTFVGGAMGLFKEDIANWIVDTTELIGYWEINTWDKIVNWTVNVENKFQELDTKVYEAVSSWTSRTITNIDTWISTTVTNIGTWADNTIERFDTWCATTEEKIVTWAENTKQAWTNWKEHIGQSVVDWATNAYNSISNWCTNTKARFNEWCSTTKSNFTTWWSTTKQGFSNWWNNIWSNIANGPSIWSRIKGVFDSLFSSIRSWWDNLKTSVSNWWDSLWSGKNAHVTVSGSSASLSGHASGGIFNREHIAAISEGNKAEAVIPLENETAMMPFVNAISNGIVASLGPMLATAGAGGTTANQPPMYVGTLIADERGLKELERKMRVIRVQEERRGN